MSWFRLTLFHFAFLSAMLLGGCSGESDPVTTPVLTQPGPDGPMPVADAGTKRAIKNGVPVKGDAVKVPYILWGGDMATFYGNGGTRTTEGSVFQKQGLVFELTDGNDFDKQVKDYKSGASPFLRGTFRMIGLAAEKVADDPGAEPIVFMQMTWSAGDHLVGRDTVKTVADLKGKKIAVQKGGPHIGMLDDVLHTANLTFKDVTVVWADNITGPGSPPELFRKDPSVDATFAITPDMLGLSGGLESAGTGAEGTVKGARVVVSTAELSHSIADVYAVRSDYYRDNPAIVKGFAIAYLKSVEEVIDLKNKYENSGSDTYMDLLQLSQNIFGSDVIPTLEEDAHGLLSDCKFVGQPGNVSFFTDKKNVHGFDDFNKRTQALAVAEGYAKKKVPVKTSPIDFTSPEITANLSKVGGTRGDRFVGEAVLSEIESMDADGVLDSRTLVSFTIGFSPNQNVFDSAQYEKEFDRVVDLAARYGNAAVVIRGHSDTTLVLRDAVRAGIESGKLKRSGAKGDYTYFLEGRPLDLNDLDAMQKSIAQSDAFKPVNGIDPRKTMQAALNLSRDRATAVRTSLIDYARAKAHPIDESQVQSQGVGIREPLVARPRNPTEAANNMRVEFRLVRVSAEAMTSSDFDF